MKTPTEEQSAEIEKTLEEEFKNFIAPKTYKYQPYSNLNSPLSGISCAMFATTGQISCYSGSVDDLSEINQGFYQGAKEYQKQNRRQELIREFCLDWKEEYYKEAKKFKDKSKEYIADNTKNKDFYAQFQAN